MGDCRFESITLKLKPSYHPAKNGLVNGVDGINGHPKDNIITIENEELDEALQ